MHGWKLKHGVDVRYLRPEITRVLSNVRTIFEYHAPDAYVPVITSGNDGTKHMPTSKHYKNLAVDLRIRTPDSQWFDGPTLDNIIGDMRQFLGSDYQVVLHPQSHIHLEYDP